MEKLNKKKQRLRNKYLDIIDNQTNDLFERLSKRVDGDTAINRFEDTHQTKNALKRVLLDDN